MKTVFHILIISILLHDQSTEVFLLYLKFLDYNFFSLTNQTVGYSALIAASLWLDKCRRRYQTRMNTMFFQDGYCAGRLVTSPFAISILTHFMNRGKDIIHAAKMGFTSYSTK